MKFGIMDVVNRVWLGDDKGPALFDEDGDLAKLFRQVAAKRLNISYLQLRVQPYQETRVRLKDRVDTVMSGAEAIEHFERGGL